MTTPSSIKFTYFNTTGRGELSRLLFAYGGVAFEDERIARDEFAALKPTLPLGQLPILQVDGNTYAQSMAIARYAAKLSGLYPQDPAQALKVDMVSETLSELRVIYIGILFREPDAALKVEKTAKMFAESVPKTFGVLEHLVSGEFFLGDGAGAASLADVQFFDVAVNGLQANFPAFSLDAAAYPKLAGVVASVRANANVAAYLASQQKK